MKTTTTVIAVLVMLCGCASAPNDGARRDRMRDCPDGMVQICETRRESLPKGDDEEIPEYEFCYCEPLPL